MESLKSLVESTTNKTNKRLEYYELLRIGEFAISVLLNHRADETTLEYAQSLLQSVLQEFETQIDALTPVSPSFGCNCGSTSGTVVYPYDNSTTVGPRYNTTLLPSLCGTTVGAGSYSGGLTTTFTGNDAWQ